MPAPKLDYEQLLYNAYDRIMNNMKSKLDDTGFVECHILEHSGETVKNKHANTFKVSFGKEKKLAHRIMYEAYNGPPGDLDVSHLCHNESCVKIEHLYKESHTDNMARIGCPGWLQFGSYTGELVSACTHTPPCIKVTRMPNLRTIGPTQVDQ